MRAILFNNVQFIYELILAQRELKSFGVEFKIDETLRNFLLPEIHPEILQVLSKRLAYFEKIGEEYTAYYYLVRKNRTKSPNQYLTHWIYPYKGKFHPQMVRALLNIMGLKENDTVLDPFIGSGTTAIEALLLGINCIGIDISPLCAIQSKVKTQSFESINEILEYKTIVFETIEDKGSKVIEKITEIKNENVKNFYLLAYLVAVSDNIRRDRDFKKSFLENTEKMILSIKDFKTVLEQLSLKPGKVTIMEGDARNLPLVTESVDGIITSPPYSVALDYVSNDAHSLKALGYELEKMREKFIGVRGQGTKRLELYNEDMMVVLKELYRVLKPQKFAVIILGNATHKGKEIKTVEFVIKQAEATGFMLVENIEKIIFGLYNFINKENILVFQKI